MKLYVTKNSIDPHLRSLARISNNPERHLKVMGTVVKSMSQRAFTTASLRPTSWAARKDKKPHNLLQKSTNLMKSIRIVSVNNSRVVIGSDKKYAVIHQLGGKAGRGKKASIPARPYMPFYKGKMLPKAASRVEVTLRSSLQIK